MNYLMPYSWNYSLGAKGGQSVKEKKDETVITDKSTEFALKIKVKSTNDDVAEMLSDIMENVDVQVEDGTITFSGPKPKLEQAVKQISKLIAEAGGQQTLDVLMDKPQKAKS